MAGILIYQTNSQFYSFVVADNNIYKKTEEKFTDSSYIDLLFNKGNLTLQQIENARKKVSEIVGKLNNNQKINVKKELSDYFN